MDLSAAVGRAQAARKSLASATVGSRLDGPKPLSATSALSPATVGDLGAVLARVRKTLGLLGGASVTAAKVGEASPGGGAPVAAGGAPDPGSLTTEAFAQGGALPAKSGVPKRRRGLGGAAKNDPLTAAALQSAIAAGMPDPGAMPFAKAPVPVLDTLPETIATDFQGLTVCIDRPAGFVQTKLTPEGSVAWTRTYTTNYGYLPGTCGGDADELDCFVGGDPLAANVYWFSILDAAGTFDEYKLVFGAPDALVARGIILAHIPERFVAPGVAVTTVAQIRALLGQEPAGREAALVLVSEALDVAAGPDYPLIWVERNESGETYKSRMDGEVAGATNEEHGKFNVYSDSRTFKIAQVGRALKAEQEEHYVLGVVLEPETTDAQGEIYSADVIRESAFNWLSDFRNIDVQHKMFIGPRTVRVVESYIAPQDLTIDGQPIRAGTWMLAVIVEDDALWAAIKRGEFTGFSMNGLSRKEPIE
jgi:hypothetical protein